jgi:acetyltransferase-like isoleucine patch superfamily enzyme
LRREHRPYFVKYLGTQYQQWYTRHFLHPQFERLGRGCTFMKPWFVEVNGGPISLGDFANIVATADCRVRLTVWATRPEGGRIDIGRYCLICPGVRVSAATEITLGDNCMMAMGVYLSDSDWHDIYDRSMFVGQSAPIRIGNNVWLGDNCIVGKGVTIGDNAIVGARAVVVKDVPDNVIVAGNPAAIIKRLDPAKRYVTREEWFNTLEHIPEEVRASEQQRHAGNSLCGWLRSKFFPRKGD